MWEKHNENIFETFEASLVELSNASVKLCFTKLPPAALFFNKFGPKSIGFLPRIISMTLPCLKKIGQMGGSHLGNKMADVNFFFKSCPP